MVKSRVYISKFRCSVTDPSIHTSYSDVYKITMYFKSLVIFLCNSFIFNSEKGTSIFIIELSSCVIVLDFSETISPSRDSYVLSLPTSPHGQKYSQEQFCLKYPPSPGFFLKVTTFSKSPKTGSLSKKIHFGFVKSIENVFHLFTQGSQNADFSQMSNYLKKQFSFKPETLFFENDVFISSRFKLTVKHSRT